MKRLLLVLALVVGFTFTTQAQSASTKKADVAIEQAAKAKVATLKSTLDLDVKQVKLMEQNLSQFEAHKKQVMDADISATAKSEKIAKMETYRLESVKQILTNDQYNQYVALLGKN